MGDDIYVDQDLLDDMEHLFLNSEAIVIAAFRVFKIRRMGDATGTQLLKALGAKSFLAGREAPQPRVLCFTVRRHKSGQGFKPTLHICKAAESAASGYQVSKSYQLKDLQELKLPASSRQQQQREQHLLVLELRVSSQPGSYSAAAESIGTFGVESESQLLLLLTLLVQLVRQSNYKLPKLTGMSLEELDKWWMAHRAAVIAALGDFTAEVLTPGGLSESGGGGSSVLVSAKEEKDLEELLDMYTMGIGDVAEFQTRLQEEHEALEAANVHSILGNVPLVDSVVFQLKKTQGLLEDLDETLVVFESKLRHMREDIAAIETNNNTLELQARNNTSLLATLQGLLQDLKIPPDLHKALDNPPFDKDKGLSNIIKAAWALHDKLQRLTEGARTCISTHLLHMRVVREAREAMDALAARFVSRAVAHLSSLFNQAVEELLQELNKNTDRAGRLRTPDHTRLHTIRARYAELIRVLNKLTSDNTKLHVVISQTINMLLRKELRTTSSELRKAAQLDMHNNPVDYSLTKDASSRAAGMSAGVGSVFSGSDEMSITSDISGRPSRRGPGSTVSKQSRSTAASIRMVARPGVSKFDGVTVTMPLNEAYQMLLDTFIPFLLSEAEAAAAFLHLYRDDESKLSRTGSKQRLLRSSSQRLPGGGGSNSGPASKDNSEVGSQDGASGPLQADSRKLTTSGKAFMSALFSGIETEFQVLVELTAKGHCQVLCLPMLAMTTHWLAQLVQRPIAWHLCCTLSSCHERLRHHFSAYVTSQLNAIEQYAAKAQGGVKGLHVLAFITQFALMSHHIEIMLAQIPDMAQLQPLARSSSTGLGAGSTCSTLPRGREAKLAGGGAAEQLSDKDEETMGKLMIGASWQLRAEVDQVYQQLVGQMFMVLERMAAADAKHGERLRMENYSYFVESVRPLVRNTTALEPYMAQAEARQLESMQAYVQQQLEYGKLWKLLEFSEKLEKLLEVVTPAEVAFQAGCSAGDMRSLISSSMKDADKKLQAMFARIKKHLGPSNLAYRAWEHVQEQLLLRYESLEEQVAECYPGLPLTPTPAELANLFKVTAAGA